jgi:hypothetical protein
MFVVLIDAFTATAGTLSLTRDDKVIQQLTRESFGN